MGATCKDCPCFMPTYITQGECRHDPPRVFVVATGPSYEAQWSTWYRFPKVVETDWCWFVRCKEAPDAE